MPFFFNFPPGRSDTQCGSIFHAINPRQSGYQDPLSGTGFPWVVGLGGASYRLYIPG